MTMFEGIFLLTVLFTDEPKRPIWNPWGPLEFSSYQDCLRAGELVSGIIPKDNVVTCVQKDTGELRASWERGPAK